jgi:Reverse transcriptase (RNA-dependent DNA polymerase)
VELLVHREPVLRRLPRTALAARAGGRWRTITTLDPADDATYRRLVERATPAIERALSCCVLANRVAGPGLDLEDWRAARGRWRRAVAAASEPGVRLRLDVADCYGSIRPRVVADALAAVGAADRAELVRLLHELATAGIPGLPVGPAASAVLANAVLARVDSALDAAGVPHVRWVDDVVVATRSRAHARRLAGEVDRELASIGLRLQDAKTRLEDARCPSHRPAPSAPARVR